MADIALVVGGGGDPLSEYAAARALCEDAGKSVATFVCNDTLMIFPDAVDFAGTLHPDKMHEWTRRRIANGHPMPYGQLWCHRDFLGFNHSTRDWQGSSGLFMTKVALENGYTHIVLCGVPMETNADHIIRHKPWHQCAGFLRGWRHHMMDIKPYTRSMSGWTRQELGPPDPLWLTTEITRKPMRPEPK